MSKSSDSEPFLDITDIDKPKLRTTLSKLTSKLNSILSDIQPLKEAIDPLDVDRKELVKDINNLLIDSGIQRIQGHGVKIFFRRGSKSISATKLLESGVPADIILKCTIEGDGSYVATLDTPKNKNKK